MKLIIWKSFRYPTGSWREGISMPMPETLWQSNLGKFPLNSTMDVRGLVPLTEMRLSASEVEFRPDKILINAKYGITVTDISSVPYYYPIRSSHTSYESEYNTAKGLINDYMKPDIKIVLIPGTQVQMMKQQGVNINDKGAVSRVLKLGDQRPGL